MRIGRGIPFCQSVEHDGERKHQDVDSTIQVYRVSETMETRTQRKQGSGGKMTDKKPPFVFVIVRMKEPYGILFASRPDDHAVFETFADLIRDEKLDKYFEIIRFDITEDIHGTVAERTKF